MFRTFNVEEAVEKEVVGFGNGSIVYTPKRWIGRTVSVVLEKKQQDIAGEAMELLKPHMADVMGIYLFGSHARGEENNESDIDILVISGRKIGLKKAGNFDFHSIARKEFAEALENESSLFLHQALKEAKPIFNEPLLAELREKEIRPDFSGFLDSTLGAFKNTSLLLDADRKKGLAVLDSAPCIYSLVLRLRSLFLMQCFIGKKAFSAKNFEKMLAGHGFEGKQISDFLAVYRAERDSRKDKPKIALEDAERLFEAAKIEFVKAEALVGK
jgi:predicted nucleotidyltransferase